MTARLLILYGSQTGNAQVQQLGSLPAYFLSKWLGQLCDGCCARQDVAERIGREAFARHYRLRVAAMDEYDIAQLPAERHVVFVASTTGQACCCIYTVGN